MRHIRLFGRLDTPNSFKVVLILEELTVPYTIVPVENSTLKEEAFLRINPNGKIPAIEDLNSGVVIWESGAIIEYLVANYDRDGKISYPGFPEKCHTLQWLFFQTSGQGPSIEQAIWFTNWHHEHLPSARERYVQETSRIIGVIDRAIRGKEWLVGDKCTYADLAFVPGFVDGPKYLGDHLKTDPEKEYPDYWRWLQKLMERPSVRRTLEKRRAAQRCICVGVTPEIRGWTADAPWRPNTSAHW